MKIQDRNGVQNTRLEGPGEVDARRTSTGGVESDDSIQVSSYAKALARLLTTTRGLPEQAASAARLEALRNEVDAGTYKPDAKKTAHKLLLEEFA